MAGKKTGKDGTKASTPKVATLSKKSVSNAEQVKGGVGGVRPTGPRPGG